MNKIYASDYAIVGGRNSGKTIKQIKGLYKKIAKLKEHKSDLLEALVELLNVDELNSEAVYHAQVKASLVIKEVTS